MKQLTRTFLTADWRYLAMLNFEVEPALLGRYVPKGTELDDRGGRHFVSLVAFLFLDTHVLGLPALFHQDFEEVNLRFYVRRIVGKESRAGVVFIREMVPLPLVAEVAKLTYHEPYRTVPMKHTIVETDGELQSVEYLFAGRASSAASRSTSLDPRRTWISARKKNFSPSGAGGTPGNGTAARSSIGSSTRAGTSGATSSGRSTGRSRNYMTSRLQVYSQVLLHPHLSRTARRWRYTCRSALPNFSRSLP